MSAPDEFLPQCLEAARSSAGKAGWSRRRRDGEGRGPGTCSFFMKTLMGNCQLYSHCPEVGVMLHPSQAHQSKRACFNKQHYSQELCSLFPLPSKEDRLELAVNSSASCLLFFLFIYVIFSPWPHPLGTIQATNTGEGQPYQEGEGVLSPLSLGSYHRERRDEDVATPSSRI